MEGFIVPQRASQRQVRWNFEKLTQQGTLLPPERTTPTHLFYGGDLHESSQRKVLCHATKAPHGGEGDTKTRNDYTPTRRGSSLYVEQEAKPHRERECFCITHHISVGGERRHNREESSSITKARVWV